MIPAPVALFAYRRPDHLRRTVEALQENALAGETLLYVFSDAARNQDDEAKVTEVRRYLRTISGFADVAIVERDTNQGLARSIISGVTEVVGRHGRVIVLEDDLVTSPHFLRYMNEALELYRDEERVISVHGYVYPVGNPLPETFFIKGADCWGWATWKRGWELFEPDGSRLLAELGEKGLLRQFDFDGAYPFTRMLKNQIKGETDSWAIRWNASAFLNDRLTLYPGKSLVHNIGVDSSGTNCPTRGEYRTAVSGEPVPVRPVPVEEDISARLKFERFFRSIHQPLYRRFWDLLKRRLHA